AAESLYRWQWQTGRLLKAIGQEQNALLAYQQAIATLQSIRGDLLAANTDVQFDFRDTVEPVYRETMQLLLEPQGSANLKQVLDTLELLKLAELQNYFGNECVQVAQSNAKTQRLSNDATVVYSVALDDRTEMIVQSPTGKLTHHAIALDRRSLQQKVDTFRQLLEKRSTDEYLGLSQKLYNDLIRPLEADLAQAKTLVFIQDGVLRQVPMAALHDGQQFLIQKYAIATTPSLSLTAGTAAQPPYSKALILGLTVERPPFAALPNVRGEVAAVKTILGGTELVDRAFTLDNLESQLEKNYPVVHVATHGKLGVNSSNSFLQAFDQRITLEQIDTILRSRRSARQAVELLTLSACQTAAGDDRAALGFAGIAVRAGVKSAIASLWYINDEATAQLIQEFYTQLQQPNVTKAEALQAAQIKLIGNFQYSHPAVWSPFVLIGNWL
ncbi:MAG TPA: CHAT domain-containing protein, partial [Thermosynechococcaceae cyanobacterium]